MNVLITGGAGFIGSHLAERLVGQGDEVVVVDNLSTGRLENIALLREKPHFSFVEGNICDVGLMESLAGKCDVI